MRFISVEGEFQESNKLTFYLELHKSKIGPITPPSFSWRYLGRVSHEGRGFRRPEPSRLLSILAQPLAACGA